MKIAERIKRRMKIGEYRKVSSLAKSFRVPVAEVRECVSDTDGLDLIVGVRAGGGYGSWKESEYEIERYQ